MQVGDGREGRSLDGSTGPIDTHFRNAPISIERKGQLSEKTKAFIDQLHARDRLVPGTNCWMTKAPPPEIFHPAAFAEQMCGRLVRDQNVADE
jgi:hypothetical protein